MKKWNPSLCSTQSIALKDDKEKRIKNLRIS